MSSYTVSNLVHLEAESIFVLREVAAQFQNPCLLFSGGKDSICVAHLARKAFWPSRIPFRFLHVDTGHNFPETIAFRDAFAGRLGVELVIGSVQDAIDRGRVQEESGPTASRNPLQTVIRPRSDAWHDFRGYAGQVQGGVFKPGDEVLVLPSGFTSRIKAIHTADGELTEAFWPLSVVITLEDEIDISRGDMIVKPQNQPRQGQDIDLMLCWFSATRKLQVGGRYLLRHTTRETKAIVRAVHYRVDVNTLHRTEGGDLELGMNDIGRISIRTAVPLLHDEYRRNRLTGSVLLIDEFTNETLAGGMIR
jgi:sulfate adenylyltransferase subunit 1